MEYAVREIRVGRRWRRVGIVVSFSDNNGLDWKEIGKATESGAKVIDLSPQVFRRYDYRLKFELSGNGTGLNALKLTHDVQHSQAPLPALGPGDNTIAFGAGPQEGTITIEGRTDTKRKRNELLVTDFHPLIEGLKVRLLRVAKYGEKGGRIAFPISTPGGMTRLRFGAHWRARDAREGWKLLVSFDDGKTFKDVGVMPGPMKASSTYVTVGGVPARTRRALVRYQSTRMRNTLCLFDFRIDADYREPFGGYRPVKITYRWEEGGQEKTRAHIASKATETYQIRCEARPVMKCLVVELAE